MHDPLSQLSGSRVLVTGATGFIGRRLCARMAAVGAVVHAVARRPAAPSVEAAEFHTVDTAVLEETRGLLERTKPDQVIHLAGHVKGARTLDQVQLSLAGNLISTVNLLTLCAERGYGRVVLAGSLEEPDFDGVEAGQCTPASPYAAAKYAASCYARMFHELYALPVVIGRIFMTYGPGIQDTRKFVPYTIQSLLAGRAPRLGSGLRPIDWIYVDDLIEGLARLAVAPGVEGRTVDLGSGVLHTGREVVARIVDLMGSPWVPEFGSIEDRGREVVRKAEAEQTASLIGWRGTTTLSGGLRRTIEWFRSRLDDKDEAT